MAQLQTEGFKEVDCTDFLQFQEVLNRGRSLDDRIVYALNLSLPTQSFSNTSNPAEQCKDLYNQLQKSYNSRESSIKRCIQIVGQRVDELRRQREASPDDVNALRKLKAEQNKLRLLRSEINVEEVVRDRSLKIYYERCRSYFKPTDIEANVPL